MAKWRSGLKPAAILRVMPKVVKSAISAQLKIEIDGLVEAIRRATPVGVDLERRPGELRDSVHAFLIGDMRYRIIADARDPKGEFISFHVEFGHKDLGGGHVPPHPFFFPTYRARKRGMRTRIAAAVRRAVKGVALGTV